MKREYKVKSHVVENTEEEREEIYERVANIFIRMAQKEFARERERRE